MIIPEGITYYTGRKQFCPGEELPTNADDSVKKLCTERASELAKEAAKEKAKEKEKPSSGNKPDSGEI
jgi:hypothetical protein